jgi:hypothetical protein
MSLIENAARTLARKDNVANGRGNTTDGWEKWVATAVTVTEVLLVPTELMIDHAHDSGAPGSRFAIADSYMAMIRGALYEHEQSLVAAKHEEKEAE